MFGMNYTWLAIFAALGALWGHFSMFLQRLRALFIVKTTLSGSIFTAVQNYCYKNLKTSPFNDNYYRSGALYVRPLFKVQEVGFKSLPTQPCLFFRKFVPIILSAISEYGNGVGTNNGGLSEIPGGSYGTLTTLRGLTNVEELLTAALDYYNEEKSIANSTSRYRIRRIQGKTKRLDSPEGAGHSGKNYDRTSAYYLEACDFVKWSKTDIGAPKPDAPLMSLALSDKIQEFITEFLYWKESEIWFREKRIPWRRGALLYGPPGTGKTSLVRAMAQLSDLPVWSYDLSSLSNEEMVREWAEMQESTPCIALFEDIDAVFVGRDNILGEMGGGLTFDCFLNCLSGIETCDGVFTMVTTNHIEKIDPALGIAKDGISTRPGRLDRMIEMSALNREDLIKIAERILTDWPDIIPDLLEKGQGFTGAQFTELCVHEALHRYWTKKAELK